MDIQNIIDAIKKYHPKQIILFGSAVSGLLGQDSDVDIAVVKQTPKPYHERIMDVRRLVRSTTPVDFFVFTPEEIERHKENNPFIHEIVTRGKIVYEVS
jgi:predicted nucleotidyltransferase